MFVRRRKGCEGGGWRDSALAGGCVSPRCSYETGEAGDGGLFHLARPAISSFSKATLGCPAPGVAFAFVVVKLPHLLSTKKSEALFVLGFFRWQRCWKLLTKGGVICQQTGWPSTAPPGKFVNSAARVVWRHEQDSELTWRPIRSRIRVPLLRKPLGGCSYSFVNRFFD